jgi:hypothetical protein
MPEPDLSSLVKLPAVIVEHLKGEPVLLGGMGAGALIAIIAVFAPAGTQIYGWIVGGLMLVLCLGKLILDSRTAAAANQSSRDDVAHKGSSIEAEAGSNEFEVGRNVQMRNNRFTASGRNKFKAAKNSKIEGTVFEAGVSRSRPLAGDSDTGAHYE